MTSQERAAEVLADHDGWQPSRVMLGDVRCICGLEYPAGGLYAHAAAMLAAAGLLIEE